MNVYTNQISSLKNNNYLKENEIEEYPLEYKIKEGKKWNDSLSV